MNSLRLAYICMHTSPAEVPGSRDAGGMNVVVRAQAEALGRRGHRVEIYTRRSDAGLPASAEIAPHVVLHQIDAGPPQPLAKSDIDHYIPEFSANLSGVAPADLIHSHHWMSGVAALDVAAAWSVPHVQSYHSIAASPGAPLTDGEPPESPDREPGERLTATSSEALVAVSSAEARTIVERLGGDPERVHIVPPGVDTDVFTPSAKADPATIVFAARLQPLKGPDVALRALAQIPLEMRPNLVMIGDVSQDFASYRAELDAIVDQHDLARWVRFLPAQGRADLARLLGEARLALVPSHSETFGLIALEAQACGTPVLATAAGGLVEAVVDGQTGRLLDTHDPQVWAANIVDLLGESSPTAVLGQVARVHARRFTWDSSAQALEALYRRLTEGGRA